MNRVVRFVLLIGLMFLWVGSSLVFAKQTFWSGNGYWSDGAKWNAGVPQDGDEAYLILGGTSIYDVASTTLDYLKINKMEPDYPPNSVAVLSQISGVLSPYEELITIDGVHKQSGGINNVSFRLALGERPFSWNSGVYKPRGYYELSAGLLEADTGVVGFAGGEGHFSQTGGDARFRSLTLGQLATGLGEFSLSGGTLSLGDGMSSENRVYVGAGGGRGHLHITGGAVKAWQIDIEKKGVVSIADAGSAAVPIIIDSRFNNSGSVTLKNSVVNMPQAFTNNGLLDLDSSTLKLKDLIVNVDGYIKTENSSSVSVSGKFWNDSSLNTMWDTRAAQLSLIGSGEHEAFFNAQDMGAVEEGFYQNFAWGALDLSKESLSLLERYPGAYDALYVDRILGLDFEMNAIKNISGNGNIYYMAGLNPELAGGTYSFLSGSGKLLPVGTYSPVATPEPATLILFSLGGVGMAIQRFRQKIGLLR